MAILFFFSFDRQKRKVSVEEFLNHLITLAVMEHVRDLRQATNNKEQSKVTHRKNNNIIT